MDSRKAVSSMIAYVLVTLVGVTTLVVVLSALGPTFDTARSTSVLSDALQSMGKLDAAIREVASEAEGSKRTIAISAFDGTYGINTTYDWLYFDYQPKSNLAVGGTAGNAYVEQGLQFADFFNWYANSSAAPVWTNITGVWNVSSSNLIGQNGSAYRNVGGPIQNWKFSATISNVSGTTGGEVFALPVSPAGLVGYWTFDEGNGSTAYDWSGNGNTGALNENVTWSTAGKYGKSALMNGSRNAVNVNSSPSLDITGTQITLSAWVNITGSPGGDGNIYHQIVGKDSTGSYAYRLMLRSSRTYLLFQADLGAIYNTSDTFTALSLNTWHFVAASYNGTNVNFYLDGQGVGSPAQTQSIPSRTPDVQIGKTFDNNYCLNGSVDEVMIFNRSLSADEMQALYETSAKKLLATGTQTITSKASPYIVLSNPAGQTKFDDVIVTQNSNDIRLIVPYNGIDINGTLRIGAGQHRVEILNGGVNAANGRTLLQINGV